VKYIRNSAILLSLLAVILPGQARAQADVNITGTVTDNNGAALKSAKVILLNRNITATTDASGKYSLTYTSTTTKPMAGSAFANAAVEPENGSLKLNLGKLREHVRVSLYSLSGTKVGEALDASLAQGSYIVNPCDGRNPSGLYLVKVQVGAENHVYKVDNVGSSRSSFTSAFNATGSASVSGLRKVSADVNDTLSVVAMGFDRGERVVTAFTGVQDFKLGAVKWTNVGYRPAGQPACGQCILDVRKPATGTKWPVIIHLHGGGMTGGDRNEPFGSQYAYFGQKYLDHGIMVVTPGYTLAGGSTTVWPQYIRDAVQASIWVQKNIEPYGGDPNNVFVTGFSAGAYLTHMMAIDSEWFAEAKFDPARFAGFISMSGQTRTHDNIRADLKVADIMKEKPEAMPMGHIRKTTIPWLITVGGDEGGTITSNVDMYNALLAKGSTDLSYALIPNQPHTCADIADANSPKRDKIFAFITKYTRP
jgi:dienelactone hydrolase